MILAIILAVLFYYVDHRFDQWRFGETSWRFNVVPATIFGVLVWLAQR